MYLVYGNKQKNISSLDYDLQMVSIAWTQHGLNLVTFLFEAGKVFKGPCVHMGRTNIGLPGHFELLPRWHQDLPECCWVGAVHDHQSVHHFRVRCSEWPGDGTAPVMSHEHVSLGTTWSSTQNKKGVDWKSFCPVWGPINLFCATFSLNWPRALINSLMSLIKFFMT